MSYARSMSNATNVQLLSSAAFTPVKQEVKDIKALGTGTITVTPNGNASVAIPVVAGDYLNLRGAITVTAADVDYLVYT